MLKNRTFYDDGAFMEEEFFEKMTVFRENAVKSLEKKEGKLVCGLTNSYLFRAVMQQKPRVLKEFVRMLLEAPRGTPISCTVLNPLALGLPSFEKERNLLLAVRIPGFWEGRVRIALQVQSPGSETVLCAVLRTRQEKGEKRRGYECTQFQRMALETLALTENTDSLSRSGFARLFTASSFEELKALSSETPVFLDAALSLAELSARRDVLLQCLDSEYLCLEQAYQSLIQESVKEERQRYHKLQALLAFQRELLHRQEIWRQKTKPVH
ncbi:MAG: hypothetical protein Q4E89_00230 [Eubacteriales bacterium]|nr:hypothetical protein [Eubacteriales bacterium]